MSYTAIYVIHVNLSLGSNINILCLCSEILGYLEIQAVVTSDPPPNSATRSHVAIKRKVGVKLPVDGNDS